MGNLQGIYTLQFLYARGARLKLKSLVAELSDTIL